MSKQDKLQMYLNNNHLNIEVEMINVGNVEMLCDATLQALQNNTKLPSSVKLIPYNQ